MTQEEKQLLLKDLCERLPYGVIVQYPNIFRPSEVIKRRLEEISHSISIIGIDEYRININDDGIDIEHVKPYLRPMSSMTEEEAIDMYTKMYGTVSKLSVDEICDDKVRYFVVRPGDCNHIALFFNKVYSLEQLDWLNEHHFDYRGLIEKDLALEATEGMYN